MDGLISVFPICGLRLSAAPSSRPSFLRFLAVNALNLNPLISMMHWQICAIFFRARLGGSVEINTKFQAGCLACLC